MAYALSLAVGLGVGLLYAVVGVRSPAPPIVALLGLLGMVLGEEGGRYLKARWTDRPPAAGDRADAARAAPSERPGAAGDGR